VIDSGAAAQDGTNAATPTPPTNCIVPEATVLEGPRGTESPLVPNPSPPASPVASPVASPGASPVASPVAATPRASLEIDITQTTRVLANCLSENKFDTVASITGDTFHGQLLGANEDVDAATYTALAATLAPVSYSIVSIENIRGTGRGTAEAVVTYTVAHQLRSGTWSFRLVNTGISRKWIVVSETPQEPRVPSGTASIAVEMSNDTFRLTPAEATGRSVKLDATNDDQGDHEMLVVKLASGVTSDALLTNPGPDLPEGVELIGQLTIPARSTGSLILTNLEPGTYTIVCLLPDETGVPHLASGMQTTFKLK
jgi:hypothetical protein